MTYKVDTSSPVLLTGATGYIAGVLIKELLDEGVTVHATVRDPSKEDRFKYLTDLAEKSKGSIKFFKGDLLVEGSFAEAMKGCSVVFHTASPFFSNVKDPQKELVDPAVNGTKNVLNQASKTPSVKKVIVTSSCAAIYTDAADTYKAPNDVLTEDVWNTTASLDYQPYFYSKTMAEKAAWNIVESQKQWKLVVINPSMVMGPGVKYHASSESFGFALQMVDGTLASGCPALAMPFVDVREVAHAHVAAAYSDKAQGRYILCGHNSNMYDASQMLVEKYGEEYALPVRQAPKLLAWLLGPYLSPPMPRRYIWNNVSVAVNFDHSKSEKELGIKYRPLKKTMNDMVAQMIKAGAVPKKE